MRSPPHTSSLRRTQSTISAACDEATAARRLHALLVAEPNQALGADADLRKLSTPPPSGLGFMTVAGVVGLSLSTNSAKELRSAKDATSNLFLTRGKGQTRMPVWITTSGGASTLRRVSLNVRLPPDTIADLVQMAIAATSHRAR